MILRLESESDILDLNEVAETGVGYQALAGITGLGLPDLSVQWAEGAGDGAVYRSRRVLARDIDLPLDVVGRTPAHLARLLSRLARTLAAKALTLVLVDAEGAEWSTRVHLVGGGRVDPPPGADVQTVITLRAPDPYFSAAALSQQRIGGDATAQPFLGSLAALPVAASQAIGSIDIDNTGDVSAYPVWEVRGPGTDLRLISPTGQTLRWTGTLTAAQSLTIDTKAGTVTDNTGTNLYALLDTAPRFWSLPPGTSTATASLLNTTAASRIMCTWRPRKWMVV
ncbi:phage distal tail protein [Streptomyces albidoflavus]